MTEAEIEYEIIQIVKDVLDTDSVEIEMENSAADHPDWDSLARIDFIVAVESQFGIKFSMEELKHFETFGDMLNLVQRKKTN